MKFLLFRTENNQSSVPYPNFAMKCEAISNFHQKNMNQKFSHKHEMQMHPPYVGNKVKMKC